MEQKYWMRSKALAGCLQIQPNKLLSRFPAYILTNVCCTRASDSCFMLDYVCVINFRIIIRVRPIPFWRPIPDTIGRTCTDTDTDTGNDITYSLGHVAHTVCTFQNITPLTLRFETFETDYRLETIGVRATVLTVETGK